MLSTRKVLDEVYDERLEQDKKFGEQNWPWNTGYGWWEVRESTQAKAEVDALAKHNQLDFAGILTEEYLEAIEETDVARAREELIQVAAVAVAAVESIDRNGR